MSRHYIAPACLSMAGAGIAFLAARYSKVMLEGVMQTIERNMFPSRTVVGEWCIARDLQRLRDVPGGMLEFGRLACDRHDDIPTFAIHMRMRFVVVCTVSHRRDPHCAAPCAIYTMTVYQHAGSSDVLPLLGFSSESSSVPDSVPRMTVVRNESCDVSPAWVPCPNCVSFILEETPPLALLAARDMLRFIERRKLARYGVTQATILICGPSGTGKSSAARVLAHLMDAVLCSEYLPDSPGHSLHQLLSVMDVECDDPVRLIVIDEVDVVMSKLLDPSSRSRGEGESHRVELRDRKDWNRHLDDIARMDRLVVVYTTNKTPKQIWDMDPHGSMIRPGRVHLTINIGGGDEYSWPGSCNYRVADSSSCHSFRVDDSDSSDADDGPCTPERADQD